MDNLESIKYTYKHRKVVDFLAKKYLSKKEYKLIYDVQMGDDSNGG